ncbi:MAG: DUF2268 domain-containing protein [bacterium]|nr:DUF2268 domain-containing protein [bacterium]
MNSVRSSHCWVLGAALLASSCGTSTPAGSNGSASTDASDQSAFEALVADVGSDIVPLDTALGAFSLAIGRLPGVELPEGRRELIPSGTGALRWVRSHWGQLTPTQQEAVTRYVTGESGDAAGGAGMVIGAAVLAAASDGIDEAALNEFIEQTLAKLAAKLGRPLGIPVELRIAASFVDGDGGMFADPVDANGGWSGEPVRCKVTIGKLGLDIAKQISNGVASAELESFIAHELFHCYSFTVGDPARMPSRPAWVMEGLAEWAGETIAGGSSENHWDGWLRQPGTDLFARTYPAIGFWAHLDENSVGLWPFALDIVAGSDAGSAAAYETALDLASPTMLPTWGPGYFRDSAYAPAWDQAGAGVPSITPVPLFLGDIGPGDGANLIAKPLSAAAYKVNLTADVITVSSSSYGLLQYPDGVVATLPDMGADVLCTDPQGCGCPDDSPGVDTIFRQTIPGEARAGLTGHLGGAVLDLAGWTLDEFCEQPPVPVCMIGEWLSEEYRAPGQSVIGGLATMSMTIDRTGRGEVVFNPEVPINARVDAEGLTPWVKLVFEGSYRFMLTRRGETGDVLGGDAFVKHLAFLEGQWIPGPEATSLVPAPGKLGSTFICEGDSLIVRAPGAVSEFELTRIEE